MAVYTHMIVPSVTIVTGENDTFAVDDTGGGDVDVVIPAGTYYLTNDGTDSDLLQVIEDQMNATLVRTYALSTTNISFGADSDLNIRVNMSAGGSYTVTWGSFDGLDLGYNTNLTVPDLLDIYWSKQAPRGWWRSNDGTASIDTVPRAIGTQISAIGGQTYTYDRSRATWEDIQLSWDHIPEEFAEPLYQTTTRAPKTLKRAWQRWRDGRPCRIYQVEYYADGTWDTIATSTNLGEFALDAAHLNTIQVDRKGPGVPYYRCENLLWREWVAQ